MSSSFFFLQAEKNDHNSGFIQALERHAESNNQQIYVVDRPLGDRKYIYDYSDRLIILAPGHKIVLMDFGANKDQFKEFVDDFTEDLASISDKFQYKSIIGRSRYWRDRLIAVEKYHERQLNTDIDESQDFPASFFELCSKVTRHTVYIAGDIFQSIFDSTVISEIKPEYLLSKCYRTDPRTLMFAHAIGMGLFESPKLRWLEDKEWEACGYIVNKDRKGQKYILTRKPLRRFEDLESEGINSVDIVKTSREKGEDTEIKIIEIIRDITNNHPTVQPDDIGIIFIDSTKNTYLSADILEQLIPREIGWSVNKAYETKEKTKGQLFVSNRNNVKGLEFPFVICVTEKINNSRSYRNALYMMLTRSFIKTYLLTSLDGNEGLIRNLETELHTINTDGCLKVNAPSDDEKERIKTTIGYNEPSMSYYDFVYKIFDDADVPPKERSKLYSVVKSVVDNDFDYDNVREVVEFNFRKMSKVA